MGHMRLKHAEELGTGVFWFVWAPMTPDGVATGELTSAMIDVKTGQLCQYSERTVSEKAREARPRITREQAEKTAGDAISAAFGKERDVRLEKPRLILSSPLSPNQGPVWMFDYKDYSPLPGIEARPGLVVDAMTGKVITGPAAAGAK
jgi:hypothetical protein